MAPTTKELLPSNDDWRARAVLLGLDSKEWLRTPEAYKYSGIRPARLYELNQSREIKTYLLKTHRDAVRGIRLWSRSSLDQYLNKKYEEALSEGNPVGQVAWAPQKKGAEL